MNQQVSQDFSLPLNLRFKSVQWRSVFLVMTNPYAHIIEPLDPQKPDHKFFNLKKLKDPRYGKTVLCIFELLNESYSNCAAGSVIVWKWHDCDFLYAFLWRPASLLHPCAAGVCGEKLWWVPGEERGCGESPQLEGDTESDRGGAFQTGSCHLARLHVGFNWVSIACSFSSLGCIRLIVCSL